MARNNRKKILLILSVILCLSLPSISLAHSGRTDSAGGHHDYNNASGLGDYHYHHGYGPHLHPDGICPYDESDVGSSATDSEDDSIIANSEEEINKSDDYASGYEDGYEDGYDVQQKKLSDTWFEMGDLKREIEELKATPDRVNTKPNITTVIGFISGIISTVIVYFLYRRNP